MPRVAVVGNVARDVVDDARPAPGGCPPFAVDVFRRLGCEGQIVTRFAERDAALFEGLLGAAGPALVLLPAAATSAFRIDHDGEERTMRMTALGARWRPEDAAALAPEIEWIHVAPLSRGDFPAETLAAFAAPGGTGAARRLSLDGQGLVRVAAEGLLEEDAAFDPAVLEHVTALKLSEHEARIVAGGRFDLAAAERLGVPEVLLTLGSRGAIVFAAGRETPVTDIVPVPDVHTTGAGDAFMVAYAVSRVDGRDPVAAARGAARLVRELLADRLLAAKSAPGGSRLVDKRAKQSYPN
jgi:sugar/nucleoside kinase (ribokinase family)